jgi:Na+:H+ antiporter, NhaC family
MTPRDLPSAARLPTLGEAMISLFSLVIGIGGSIYFFGLAPHIPMLFGVAVASLVALRCGHNWQSIQDGMVAGITNALPSIIILMIIGVLIGVWILGGVVPTLIYYGL